MAYRIAPENFIETLEELQPLYQQHYREMQERLAADGVHVPDYNPQYEQYVRAFLSGTLLHFVVRTDAGEPVGYCNCYVYNNMHNGEFNAKEDILFVRKDHRNGVGKRLVKFGLEELRKRGVKRLRVEAMTDLRVVNLWRRMGFKPVATSMIYNF